MNRIADDPYLLTALIIASMGFVLGMVALLSPRIDVNSVRQMSRLLSGYHVPPIVVSFARRGLTSVVTLVVTWLASLLVIADGTDLAAVAGAVALGIETVGWGLFDQLRKPRQNQAELGSDPVNLGSAYVDLRFGRPPGVNE
jgi:hypothetical protein